MDDAIRKAGRDPGLSGKGVSEITWGECKLAALQTMFANEGATLNADDSNQDYLNAMPAKANEAMHQLALVGRPLLKQFAITVGGEEDVTEDSLTLPERDARYKVKLTDYIPRFRAMEREQLYLDSGGIYGAAEDWSLEGDDVLLLPGDVTGTYTIWYDAYPQTVNASTPDDTELEMPAEAAALVPLYIAGELYKEDELAMATMFRNEFEDGLQKLRAAWEESGSGFRAGSVSNTTGWW